MTFFRLLWASLWYHRRGNFAVFLGMAVGTAVLTGALLVGDSLRGSLRELTLQQLGWVEQSLVNNRFFRQEVAAGLPAEHAAPAILMQATVAKSTAEKGTGRHVPDVVLLGVDGKFWTGGDAGDKPGGADATFWDPEFPPLPGDAGYGVVLGAGLARDLGVRPGQEVTITFQKTTTAPRESLLGRREGVVSALTLPVRAVLDDDSLGSRFSLNPGPATPRNAFLPLKLLQGVVTADLREQVQRGVNRFFPERPINAILVAGADGGELKSALRDSVTLADWGLRFRDDRIAPGFEHPKNLPYWSLESREMFIPPAVRQAVQESGLRAEPTLVYLVDSITPEGDPNVEVPYAVVAATDLDAAPPLGPILPEGMDKLEEDELLLVDWEQSRLKDVQPGQKLVLAYFDPNDEGQLRKVQSVFRVAGHAPLDGVRADPYLTPEFPGITDADIGDWDPPFPFERARVKKIDEDYWDEHRTTPKAYIRLDKGQEIWGSRFGNVTSLRIVKPEGRSADDVQKAVLAKLDPEAGGFAFRAVRENMLQASQAGIDFGVLFLGFSFFLIAAALMLVGLLFRLNIDQRAAEIGLLLAVGHTRRTVRRLLITEGGLLALLGGLLGSLIAIWYAGLLLGYLASNWPGGLPILGLHVTPFSLLVGYLSAVVVGLLTVFWATRVLGKLAPRDLLHGVTTPPETGTKLRKFVWSKSLIAVGLAGGAACFVAGLFVQEHEMQAMSFLLSGMLLLTAGLAAVWLLMLGRRQTHVTQGGWLGLAKLGTRNAARHPTRSLLTMGLLASATFLVVAVQSFHRNPTAHFLDKDGGSGGFAWLAETEVPVYQNLNDPEGLAESMGDGADRDAAAKLLQEVEFYPFRVKQGDDASCLNLYKPQEPRLFGVPGKIIDRGGFQFAGTLAETDAEKANPWLLLRKDFGDAVPVFGENNTVVWILKSQLGGEVEVTDGNGNPVKLKIVGLLRDSVFQSELLLSDGNFQKLYPRLEGFNFFLLGGRGEGVGSAIDSLGDRLGRYGFVATPTPERLRAYLAVENTYLATFQALGGLALLLGALGLAVVLVRTVWERRGELALLRAVGFRRSALGYLVLAENGYLLVLGLLVGTAAALVSVAPHLVEGGSEVLWWQLGGLLLLVLLVGSLAGAVAAAFTLRAPLLPALRNE